MKGYASTPGTGPRGSSCASCLHIKHITRQRKRYKCGLIELSYGPSTDIKLSSPGCHQYERT